MSVAAVHDVDVAREYRKRTRESARRFERFRACLPGGETRTFTFHEPYPVVLERGEGPVLVDVDGNRYVDVLNNYTSLVHGHAFAPVVEAIAGAARTGTALPAPHPRQLAWAELLQARYPAVELVRFTNSGSEAAILAARIARRSTGRRRLLLFEGAYHGTGADFAGETADASIVPYGDVDRARAALDDSVAAVFAEPFLGTGGVIEASPAFLHGVREEARRRGALFVLDEVQSLRNAPHGMHAEAGLEPDLLLMGKIIGGGLPVGAVGGRREIMAVTAGDRSDRLPHSGTFNGNPVTAAAGLAGLAALDGEAIERLNRRARELAGRIEAEGATAGVRVVVRRSGSIMHVHLAEGDPPALLHLSLLLEGVYAAPRGMLNLSTAMSDEHCAAVASGYARAFARMRRGS
ncbi:MAG: aminotransferase class III-fold pyridoxal phosphate-dependent enzyme [Actinomycetota bacterium]|nr:aminotransferase class III-fold pyridoxal phosphate-dependent enzyme [Actinomycetota bacterium]